MAGGRTGDLECLFRVLRCQTDGESVGLGLVGVVQAKPTKAMVFFITRAMLPDLKGMDSLDRALVAKLADALDGDVRELIADGKNPADLLNEIAARYRGTVYADKMGSFRLQPKPSATPLGGIMPILDKAVKLFAPEVLGSSWKVVAKKGKRGVPESEPELAWGRTWPSPEAEPVLATN